MPPSPGKQVVLSDDSVTEVRTARKVDAFDTRNRAYEGQGVFGERQEAGLLRQKLGFCQPRGHCRTYLLQSSHKAVNVAQNPPNQ